MGYTNKALLVCVVEKLLQEPDPEFVEHLLQVGVGASVVAPEIRVQVREDLSVLYVQSPPG